jgi:8-oxo-dGTP pyrophosphatase MutT (NUDIX family)
MSLYDKKIGHFMVAVGAIIEDVGTNKILLVKRNDPFHFGEWEVTYGRLDQHEEILEGLARELKEETGITKFEVIQVLRLWHIYRGEKKAENEVMGTTFHIQVSSPTITLSDEHSEFRWVSVEEALQMISVKGIKADMAHFAEMMHSKQQHVLVAQADETTSSIISRKK